MGEVWKDIKSYGGMYQVSDFGNVKSLKRTVEGYDGRKINYKELILKQRTEWTGYKSVKFCVHYNEKILKVHRLVAECFIINEHDKSEINHIDGDKANNYVDNLEWVTRSENMLHAYANGLKDKPKGENNGRSKLTKEDVIKIKTIIKNKNYTQKEMAKLFNVSVLTISNIKRNKNWTHIEV